MRINGSAISTLLFLADFVSVLDRRPTGERDQLLPALEALRDFDLSLTVASRRDRRELRTPVDQPEYARLPVDLGDRRLGHDDPRARLLALRRLRGEGHARGQVGQHVVVGV